MKNILIPIFLFLFTFVSFKNVLAGEILGISTPYLPNSISIVDSEDLVSNIILTNTSTYLNYSSKNTANIFKPKKIIRNETDVKTFWDIEYTENQSLNRTDKFTSNKILGTIDFILKNDFMKQSLSSSLHYSLSNIEKITFSETTDGFIARFALKSKDTEFLSSLGQIPVINTDIATILSTEITKGTNLPLYGKFMVTEAVPDSHFMLIKNPNYGLGSDPASIEKVNIKKFNDSEARLRAIRSGSIAIIVAPTTKEISDAQTDPTLEVIDSPFAKKTLKILKDSDSDESYDLSHLIIRKSLKPDNNFINFFELHGLSKSVL